VSRLPTYYSTDDDVVVTPGTPEFKSLPASLLIAFQTQFCNKMSLCFGPAESDFISDSYTNGEYVQLFFDGDQPNSFYTANT
jgi:hypothetical protein